MHQPVLEDHHYINLMIPVPYRSVPEDYTFRDCTENLEDFVAHRKLL